MTFEECLLVLGLEKAYTDEQLKNAYRNSALVWHPDRFQNPSEELKKRAEREMQRVNEAFESLKSNRFTHTQAYTSSSAQPTPPPKASTPPRPSAPPPRTTPPPYIYNSSNTSAPAPSERGTSGSVRRKGDKNFSTTIVLSVFLGLVGVDRFYLGYFWSGLFKALTYCGLGIM
ncbi:MAG: NINE protein, partial [Rhabdochlamydiaceae bacterium]